MQQTDHDGGQSEVIAFLGSPDAYPNRPAVVERMETHGALVFLAGDEVYKIKREVRFSYMDFSTLELRRAAVFRELEVNLPHAPELYLDAVAITRGPGRKARHRRRRRSRRVGGAHAPLSSIRSAGRDRQSRRAHC